MAKRDILSLPDTINGVVQSIVVTDGGDHIYTFATTDDADDYNIDGVTFIQTEDATEDGVAIHSYGAVIVPSGVATVALEIEYRGTVYQPATLTVASAVVGTELAFAKESGE